MRFALNAAVLWFALSLPAWAAKITPGMKLEAVKTSLKEYGYEVDARKYGLSISSGDKNIALDFCRIDSEITLVVGYDRRDDVVTALDLFFISKQRSSEHRAGKTQTVVRAAEEIELEEGGIYTLKLKRGEPRAEAVD